MFIPEKGTLNKRMWVKPYRYTGISVSQSYPVFISFTNTVKLSLKLSTINLVITTPFSYKLLLRYVNRAAVDSHAAETVTMQAADQNDKLLTKENKAKFKESKKGIPLEDAKLIYSLGDAVFRR